MQSAGLPSRATGVSTPWAWPPLISQLFPRNLCTLSTGMFPRSLGLRTADTHGVPLAQLLPPRPVLDLQVLWVPPFPHQSAPVAAVPCVVMAAATPVTSVGPCFIHDTTGSTRAQREERHRQRHVELLQRKPGCTLHSDNDFCALIIVRWCLCRR